MRMKLRFLLIGLLLGSGSLLNAQPFINDMPAFARMDSLQPPTEKGILFIGSSSFTRWKDLEQWFPEKRIINRAFGGSTLLDQIRYVDRVVYPYNPIQVVIYCGENDIATSTSINADTVEHRFKQLYQLIRSRYPRVRISFVSIKPSPSRASFLSTVIDANKRIEQFCRSSKKTDFIDVFTPMLNADQSFREELFLSDRLHMNEKGYLIWQTAIAPYLQNTQSR